jgi:hypothetical protein
VAEFNLVSLGLGLAQRQLCRTPQPALRAACVEESKLSKLLHLLQRAVCAAWRVRRMWQTTVWRGAAQGPRAPLPAAAAVSTALHLPADRPAGALCTSDRALLTLRLLTGIGAAGMALGAYIVATEPIRPSWRGAAGERGFGPFYILGVLGGGGAGAGC